MKVVVEKNTEEKIKGVDEEKGEKEKRIKIYLLNEMIMETKNIMV